MASDESETLKKEKLSLIEKKYVHKWDTQNIFISNVRRAFPTIIKQDVFEEKVLNTISKNEKSGMTMFFSKIQFGDDFFLGAGEYYVLKSIVPFIEKKTFEAKLATFSEEDRRLIQSLYKSTNLGDYYILTRFISELEEKKILLLFDLKAQCVIHDDKLVISNIFEKLDFYEKEDVYYSRMYVDPMHKYFFEHPNEHVPGMMALEALRQFGIACCHIYGHIPIEGSRFIITALNVKFISFIEFTYPITLMGKVVQKKLNKSGQWTYGNMELQIIQKNEIVSDAYIEAVSISDRLFEKIRSSKYHIMEQYRFYPTLATKLFLTNPTKKTKINAKLLNVSVGGFFLKIEKRYEEEIKNNCHEFSLTFSNLKPVKGTCEFAWNNGDTKDNHYILVGFKFMQISEEDLQNLRDCIGKCCKVLETHEVF